MYVDPVVMNMIRKSAIRITESLPEPHLKIFRRIGFVPSAVLEKTYLSRLLKICFFQTLGLDVSHRIQTKLLPSSFSRKGRQQFCLYLVKSIGLCYNLCGISCRLPDDRSFIVKIPEYIQKGFGFYGRNDFFTACI